MRNALTWPWDERHISFKSNNFVLEKLLLFAKPRRWRRLYSTYMYSRTRYLRMKTRLVDISDRYWWCRIPAQEVRIPRLHAGMRSARLFHPSLYVWMGKRPICTQHINPVPLRTWTLFPLLQVLLFPEVSHHICTHVQLSNIFVAITAGWFIAPIRI